MANNPYVNKVKYGNDTLIDLTDDTVTAADVAQGKTFHLPSGLQATGSAQNLNIYVQGESIVIPPSRASVVGKSVVMLPYANRNIELV